MNNPCGALISARSVSIGQLKRGDEQGLTFSMMTLGPVLPYGPVDDHHGHWKTAGGTGCRSMEYILVGTEMPISQPWLFCPETRTGFRRPAVSALQPQFEIMNQ